MITLLLIAILLLALASLWLPMVLLIDTAQSLFYVGWGGRLGVQIRVNPEGEWELVYRMVWWRRSAGVPDWSRFLAKPPGHDDQAKTVKKRSSGTAHPLFYKMFGQKVLQRVRIKQLYIDWDTDDVLLNATLYPVFYHLSAPGRYLAINFLGERRAHVHLQILPLWLAGAFISTYFTYKK